MLKRRRRSCQGRSVHQLLLGGRASAAAFHPLLLLNAILEGIEDTEHAGHAASGMTKDKYDVSLVLSRNAIIPYAVDAHVANAVKSNAEKCDGSKAVASDAQNAPVSKAVKQHAQTDSIADATDAARAVTENADSQLPCKMPVDNGGHVTVQDALCQLRNGCNVLHEQPREAQSWRAQPMQQLPKHRDIHVVHCEPV